MSYFVLVSTIENMLPMAKFLYLMVLSLPYIIAFDNESKPFIHGLTRDEKIEILTAHNMYRRRVREGKVRGQPRGVIVDLKWSDELTKFAQYFLETYIKENGECPNNHNPDRCWYRRMKVEQVGENINYGRAVPEEAVQAWFDEHQDYKFSRWPEGAKEPGAIIGHYTQLVWGRTRQVGCAAAGNCVVDGMHFDMMLLCNYWPAGNTDEEYPYYMTHKPDDWDYWYDSYNDSCRWKEILADNFDIDNNIMYRKVIKPYHEMKTLVSSTSLYDQVLESDLQELVCNVFMSPSANEIVDKYDINLKDIARDCLDNNLGRKPVRKILKYPEAHRLVCNYTQNLAQNGTDFDDYMKWFCAKGL